MSRRIQIILKERCAIRKNEVFTTNDVLNLLNDEPNMNYNKLKSYLPSNITIHTCDDENMKQFIQLLNDNYNFDLNFDDIKFSYEKNHNPNPETSKLKYFGTLNFEFPNVITQSPSFKLYCDENIINYIKSLCDCKFANRSLWYPNKPDELVDAKNKYYYGTENKIKYPIYIISKGRPNIKGTAKFLDECNIDYRIVIEPNEYDEYIKYNDINKIIVAPENFSERGQGGIPVRNFVWEHSIQIGAKKHWILDDNIINYKRVHKGQKTIIKSPYIFSVIEEFTDRFENVKMSGHNYSFFSVATNQSHPIILNTRIYSSILLSNDIYPEFAWRGRYNEDTDLSIRLLKSNYPTILFNSLTANKATTMTCKGGNTDTIYSVEDAHLKKSLELKNNHPDCVEVVERFGRWHHLVNYNIFKNLELIYNDYGLEIFNHFDNNDNENINTEYDIVLI